MEMMNRLLADSLDGRKFIEALSEVETASEVLSDNQRRYWAVFGKSSTGENRQQRRARERAERRAKSQRGVTR